MREPNVEKKGEMGGKEQVSWPGLGSEINHTLDERE